MVFKQMPLKISILFLNPSLINRAAIWNVSLESKTIVHLWFRVKAKLSWISPAGEVGPIHFSSLHLITFQLNTMMESHLCSVHPSQHNITWNLILVEGNFLRCKVGVSKWCATQMYFAFGIFVPKSLNDNVSAHKRFLHDYYCISWTMRNVQLLPPSTIPNTCKFFVKRRAGLMLT